MVDLSDIEERERWIHLGMAADAVLHEIGNDLNRITMQAAILIRMIPEAHRPDLQLIRDDAKIAGNRLRPIRQVRSLSDPRGAEVDLAELITDRAKAWDACSLTIEPVPMRIASRRLTLQVLIDSLFKLVQQGSESFPAEIRVEAIPDAGHVRLAWSVGTAPAQTNETLDLLNDENLFAMVPMLDRLLIESLIKQTRATLTIGHEPKQGFRLECRWPRITG